MNKETATFFVCAPYFIRGHKNVDGLAIAEEINKDLQERSDSRRDFEKALSGLEADIVALYELTIEQHITAPEYEYRIDPRAPSLGGGYHARFFESGEEVGGGVFPIEENTAASPKDADSIAFNDATAAAQEWLNSRA